METIRSHGGGCAFSGRGDPVVERRCARQRLGIVGGMGPAATARLLRRIVEFTEASRDQDHLEVTVLNRPQIPDRSAYLLGVPGAPSFVGPLQQAALELEALGCSVLATPCNTAHARASRIAAVLQRGRLLSMVEATAGLLAMAGYRRVGLLATEGAAASGVYDDALSRRGVEAVMPDAACQRQVQAMIYGEVKAGKVPSWGQVMPFLAMFSQVGCDAVVLGCTELSLLGAPSQMGGMAVVDALDVLAASCVAACGASVRRCEVDRSFAERLRPYVMDGAAVGEALLSGGGEQCAALQAS